MNGEIRNPYKPGAAHAPPYLAGRSKEREVFRHLLTQDVILQNMVLTGVRGIGKTVLLREFYKQDAVEAEWLWLENDISESVSLSEEQLLTRLIVDLSFITSGWVVEEHASKQVGFGAGTKTQTVYANSDYWRLFAANTGGFVADKLKAILELTWQLMRTHAPKKRGIVFAYDEAQNFSDNAADKQYPLSVLLEVFSYLQSKQIPFMLALTGLPPLHSKMVEARTYSERMFRVVTLQNLNRIDAYDAILKPLKGESKNIIDYFKRNRGVLYDITEGYPYFIQYWCQKLYDAMHYLQDPKVDIVGEIQELLDEDFFAGRWSQLSDRERDLLFAAAHTMQKKTKAKEFAVQDVVKYTKKTDKPFSSSHANQMLNRLTQKGMVFRNRYGKYMLAVPMLDDYILRQDSK